MGSPHEHHEHTHTHHHTTTTPTTTTNTPSPPPHQPQLHTPNTPHTITNTTPPTHETSWTRNAVAKPLHREDDDASLSRAASSTLLDRVQEFHPHDFQWAVDMMQQCLPFTQQGSLPWFCRTSPSLDAHTRTTRNIHCCVDLHGHLLITPHNHTPARGPCVHVQKPLDPPRETLLPLSSVACSIL